MSDITAFLYIRCNTEEQSKRLISYLVEDARPDFADDLEENRLNLVPFRTGIVVPFRTGIVVPFRTGIVRERLKPGSPMLIFIFGWLFIRLRLLVAY
jgi:hypothetical protein